MAKKKKKKPKYNKESAIISAIKRTFSRSPFVSDLYASSRQDFPKYNKDGSLSKKPAVRYKCVECKKWHMRTNTQADHPKPVVPLDIPMKHACLDVIMNRLWVKTSELQILCKPCHKVKSKEENATRREWKSKDKEKHIIYRTTNSINGKFYIGIHSTFDYDDGYMGSGNAIKASIKKYGKDNFYRKILFVFGTRDDALKKEKEIVDEAFVKNSNTYNLIQGGASNSGNGKTRSIEHTTKIANSNRGQKRSAQTKARIGAKSKGRKQPQQAIQKRKEACYKKIKNCRGQVFNSLKEAVFTFGFKSDSGISHNLAGKIKHSGKYHDGTRIKWSYLKAKLDK